MEVAEHYYYHYYIIMMFLDVSSFYKINVEGARASSIEMKPM